MVVTSFRLGPGALQIRNSHRHAGNAPETKSLSIGASSSVKVAVVRWTSMGVLLSAVPTCEDCPAPLQIASDLQDFDETVRARNQAQRRAPPLRLKEQCCTRFAKRNDL